MARTAVGSVAAGGGSAAAGGGSPTSRSQVSYPRTPTFSVASVGDTEVRVSCRGGQGGIVITITGVWVSGSRFQVSGSRFQVSALPSRVAAGGCAGGLGFDFCVFAIGCRQAFRSEWPCISIIFTVL